MIMKSFFVPYVILSGSFAAAQILSIPDFPIRSFDGTDRNDDNGKANSPLLRLAPRLDVDLADESLSNPRTVSNLVSNHPPAYPSNDRKLSDMVWQWGQFIDHDFALTSHTNGKKANIPVPQDDATDVLVKGGCKQIPFTRTDTDPATGEQVNLITAFLDGSMVYGSDEERAKALRSFVDGKLNVSDGTSNVPNGNLLPLNDHTVQIEMANGINPKSFAAGDIRANEQLGLIAMHTLFVREHNRLAEKIKKVGYDNADDEKIYQLARKLVIAEIQIITYKEFLPAVLGQHAPRLEDYSFNENVNPQLSIEFSTIFFRFGHSMLSKNFRLVDDDGQTEEFLELREAFFKPSFIADEPKNLNRIIRGLITTNAQELDCKVIDDVRSFLFSQDGSSTNCLDLGALNIQRGRDHAIPKYNDLRVAMGLGPITDFTDVTKDKHLQEALASAYANCDDIDAWMGALAEDHLPGASVGELLATGIAQEFTRLRDGDPFFYQRIHTDHEIPRLSEIIDLEKVNLGYVIEKNLDVKNASYRSVFFTSRILERDDTSAVIRIKKSRNRKLGVGSVQYYLHTTVDPDDS